MVKPCCSLHGPLSTGVNQLSIFWHNCATYSREISRIHLQEVNSKRHLIFAWHNESFRYCSPVLNDALELPPLQPWRVVCLFHKQMSLLVLLLLTILMNNNVELDRLPMLIRLHMKELLPGHLGLRAMHEKSHLWLKMAGTIERKKKEASWTSYFNPEGRKADSSQL